ncbi:MAG: hypothetical protein A2Z20_10075 [Bdellovibrionales bacterium RBG_16_40_8]|nr:MAG: hypothetical protein A2Z20_10075 [Bdellovibrionales bacterium RBG_16_40_8]
MSESSDIWIDLDPVIEDQLNLQVTIAYDRHHQFMRETRFDDCKQVLDIGTGNGLFLRRLAGDHPDKSFVGVDKRQHFLDRCNLTPMKNISFCLADVQDAQAIKLSDFDGVLMRYFLLHVSNARDILKNLKSKLKKGAHICEVAQEFR